MNPELTIVTVADRFPDTHYLCHREFFASARKFGHEPLVLGQGPNEFTGLGSKPKLLQRAIKQGLIRTPYILFTDCFDVVFQQDLVRAPEALHFYAADIVWNAERNCFPDAGLAQFHSDFGTSFRYLNSGFGIGRTEAFEASLEEMNLLHKEEGLHTNQETLTIEHANDQDWWMRQHLFGKACRSALDYRVLLCMTMCGLERRDVVFSEDEGDPVIACFETGHVPFALHFNGPSKTAGLLEPILNHLGYPR